MLICLCLPVSKSYKRSHAFAFFPLNLKITPDLNRNVTARMLRPAIEKDLNDGQKLNNLKEAARTFNYLSENNLLNYEDFQQHVSDVDASVKAADQRIIQINNELSTQKIIQKHCDSYRLCRKVIEDCKSAKNLKAYRTKHQAEYQLHDSLKKELQDLGITKIPSSNKIQKRIENLESEQTSTVRENRNCRKNRKH